MAIATTMAIATIVRIMGTATAIMRHDRTAGMAMVVLVSPLASAAVDTAAGNQNGPQKCGLFEYARLANQQRATDAQVPKIIARDVRCGSFSQVDACIG